MKYNCTRCGAGISADKTLCAEREKDDNMVEVVRCKDCGFLSNKVGRWCGWHDGLIPDLDDYCSWGKRRTE